MAYLFWRNGHIECPPCPKCGHEDTDEIQEWTGSDRVIYIKCRSSSCLNKERLGTFRRLGHVGHNFVKIGP